MYFAYTKLTFIQQGSKDNGSKTDAMLQKLIFQINTFYFSNKTDVSQFPHKY